MASQGCPRCGSQQLIKAGIVRRKQRHRCKDCNFSFVDLHPDVPLLISLLAKTIFHAMSYGIPRSRQQTAMKRHIAECFNLPYKYLSDTQNMPLLDYSVWTPNERPDGSAITTRLRYHGVTIWMEFDKL